MVGLGNLHEEVEQSEMQIGEAVGPERLRHGFVVRRNELEEAESLGPVARLRQRQEVVELRVVRQVLDALERCSHPPSAGKYSSITCWLQLNRRSLVLTNERRSLSSCATKESRPRSWKSRVFCRLNSCSPIARN